MKSNLAPTTNHKLQHQQLIALKIAFCGSIVLVLNSLIVGLIVNSITLLLDSSVSIVVAIATGLMYATTKKVHQPPDELYNFGYGKFEPFTVMVHGGLVIASCIISVKYAIMNIIHVEDISEYTLPTFTVFASLVFAAAVMLYLRLLAKRNNSAMMKSLSVQWTNDTISYAGIFSGFLIGFILIHHGYSGITPFIDPAMTIILSIMLVRAPIKVVIENVHELLDAVPKAPTRGKIREIVNHHFAQDFEILRMRSRKAGHKVFVDICFSAPQNLTLLELEQLQEQVEQTLTQTFVHSDVTVTFKARKSHPKRHKNLS